MLPPLEKVKIKKDTTRSCKNEKGKLYVEQVIKQILASVGEQIGIFERLQMEASTLFRQTCETGHK